MSITSALVTGANRGLGYQFVKQLLSHPSSPVVIATCRRPDDATELSKLKANPKLHIHQLNLNDFNSYETFTSQVSSKLGETGLSLLVNNAGVMENVDLRSGTLQQMIDHYAINSVAPFGLIRSLLPLMQAAAKKKKTDANLSTPLILNMSAILGSMSTDMPAPGGGHLSYRMTKASLNMVTKMVASDMKKRGINIVSVHPGWVSTDMGGPKAPMTPEVSVSHLIKLIATIDESKNGKFLNYDGKIMTF